MGCCCNKTAWPYRYYYAPYPVAPNYPVENPAVFIRGKEIDCWFAGVLFERHIDGLVFQYDTGLQLNIRGLKEDAITAVEFSRVDTPDSAVSYPVELVDPLAGAEPTEEETAPEDLPYFSVAIPDELLVKPGTVVAYLVYQNEDEYRTVKAIYITVHERQALKVEDGSSDDGCGCDDKIAALEATIAELAAKVEELTNNAGG